VRIVAQRVSSASVAVGGEVVASIGPGLCLLVGVAVGDSAREAAAAADKLAGLRVFADFEGKMNRSLVEIGGEALVVSQFTLLGDARRGRRPSFTAAAPPEVAAPLVDLLAARLRDMGVATSQGIFGAKMEVALVNDGPVTLVVEVTQGSIV
jgi:D-aminoacyl-tRNA deacylase